MLVVTGFQFDGPALKAVTFIADHPFELLLTEIALQFNDLLLLAA